MIVNCLECHSPVALRNKALYVQYCQQEVSAATTTNDRPSSPTEVMSVGWFQCYAVFVIEIFLTLLWRCATMFDWQQNDNFQASEPPNSEQWSPVQWPLSTTHPGHGTTMFFLDSWVERNWPRVSLIGPTVESLSFWYARVSFPVQNSSNQVHFH